MDIKNENGNIQNNRQKEVIYFYKEFCVMKHDRCILRKIYWEIKSFCEKIIRKMILND